MKLTKEKTSDLEIDNYINWKLICEEFNLKTGDISLHQILRIEMVFREFINQNRIK